MVFLNQRTSVISRSTAIAALALTFSFLFTCKQNTVSPDQGQMAPPDSAWTAALSDSSIRISWLPVHGASSYGIYRDTTIGGEFGFIDVTSDTLLVDTALQSGTLYHYRIRAFGENVFSPLSAFISGSTLPLHPNFIRISATPNQVSLKWNAAKGARAYHVSRCQTSDGDFDSIGSSADTTYVDTTVLTGTPYFYRVRTEGSAGPSAWSPAINEMTILGKPQIRATALSCSTIAISWQPLQNAVRYRLSRSEDNITFATLTTSTDTTFLESGLQPSTAVYYQVVGIDGEERLGEVSNTDSATTLPGWAILGEAGFSHGQAEEISLCFLKDTAFVAYRDMANLGRLSVMKFSGTQWEYVGAPGFTLGSVNDIQLRADNNSLLVAFKDWGAFGRASVMKNAASGWAYLGTPGFSDSTADGLSMGILSGVPHLAFRDGSDTGRVTLAKFINNQWQTVGEKGFSDSSAGAISLAFDNTTPYVAYCDESDSSRLSVRRFNGTSWEAVGSGPITQGPAYFVSMAIIQTSPYVAFRDMSANGKASVVRFDGSSWVQVGGKGFSQGQVDFMQILIDNNIPSVVYYDWIEGGVVKQYDSGNWTTFGGGPFKNRLALFPSSAFLNGIPYIAYQSPESLGKVVVVRFK